MPTPPPFIFCHLYNRKMNTERGPNFPFMYAGFSLVQIPDMLHILACIYRIDCGTVKGYVS